MSEIKSKRRTLSMVSVAYIENNLFLKKYLTRFFSSQQDIEDVVQEAYLRAYVAEQKKGIEHPKAFLFRVAKNVALTKLTRKSKQITDYLEELASPVVLSSEASSDEELEADELLGVYCEAVATLSDKCREVYLLRKVHGLTHKEIAERMSLTTSSIEKYLRHGVLTCDLFVTEYQEGGSSPRVPVTRKIKR